MMRSLAQDQDSQMAQEKLTTTEELSSLGLDPQVLGKTTSSSAWDIPLLDLWS